MGCTHHWFPHHGWWDALFIVIHHHRWWGPPFTDIPQHRWWDALFIGIPSHGEDSLNVVENHERIFTFCHWLLPYYTYFTCYSQCLCWPIRRQSLPSVCADQSGDSLFQVSVLTNQEAVSSKCLCWPIRRQSLPRSIFANQSEGNLSQMSLLTNQKAISPKYLCWPIRRQSLTKFLCWPIRRQSLPGVCAGQSGGNPSEESVLTSQEAIPAKCVLTN